MFAKCFVHVIMSIHLLQLIKKLQTGEAAIESLNAQVHDLGSSESLLRAKEQHESLLNSMKQKYESEIYELKETLDQSDRGLEEKVI